jgi:hypothetical protein
MDMISAVADNDEVVDHGVPCRQTMAEHRQVIFFTCRTTMVNGKLKKGIFKELVSQLQFKPRIIAKKLATLLSNHPGEEEHAVIARNHHILFKPGHSDRRTGKHKYNGEELTATVAAVPLKQRMNYRHLATKIGVPRTTVYYFLKPRPKRISRTIAAALEDNDETKILKKHLSALKPYLSEEVKQHRF